MVQGVGFRYIVQRMAAGLTLKGWVRNLSDGRVEITIEGEKEKIDQLFKKIDQHFGTYVTDKQVTYQESKAEFKDFKIIV